MSVWHDSDHSWAHTELAPKHLPTWEYLTEAMKMFVGFDVGMELQQCYTFTAHIAPALMVQWTSMNHGFMKNVQQRLARALKAADLQELPYTYLVESRTRSGRSTTRPHLHGFIIADTPTIATQFQTALEQAFHPDLKRLRRTREIQVKRGYDFDGEFLGRGRWVSYVTKNADRWDARLGKRRVHFSRAFTDLARLAWDTRRMD